MKNSKLFSQSDYQPTGERLNIDISIERFGEAGDSTYIVSMLHAHDLKR